MLRLPSLVVPTSPAMVRRQESVVIGLNLVVLAAIACAHLLFGGLLGTPSHTFFVLVLGRFLMLGGELAWVHSAASERDGVLLAYASASIWVNISFAFALSAVSGIEDSHYVALMVIPVIAAGFRYRPPGIAIVVAASAALTVLEVVMYYSARNGRGGSEYFEAAGVALLYVVVALVVAFLAAQLRREQDRLQQSLHELQSTRDRLVQEEKLAAVGRLAGAIAHEVRNPVAMITSSLALAHEPACGDDKRLELCNLAAQEAGRLETLTSDFLQYARQREVRREPTEVATALGYVAGIAQGRVPEAGIGLTVRCPEGLVASFDPTQLHQALLNLVGNAIDATPRGGTVILGATSLDDGGVELWVENDGQPVPAAEVSRLFEPFFTTKQNGTGLGLAITRNIARVHGGDVSLARNEPGAVRFAMCLPGSDAEHSGGGHGPDSGR
jgi:two-component system, NtrC family, sensor histidine kinase HydH